MSAGKVKFLMVLNDLDWLWSHRLPLARGILSRGWELHLACAGAAQSERLKETGMIGHDLPDHQAGKLNPLVIPLRLIELAKIIHREKPDVIHAITIRYVLYTGFVARLMMTGPVVFTVAGLGLLFSSRSIKMKILRLALWPLLKFVFFGKDRHIIFQNPDDRDVLIYWKLVDANQATLIRGSGVDLKEFPYVPEPPSVKPRVLFSSRLLKDKGIYEFVEVAKHLKQKGVAAEFVVAGKTYPGNPGSIAQEVIEDWHRRKIVNWLGQVDNMQEILASAALVVLPSYYGEGVPKILLEAAATGRAIITCNMPGCREAVIDEVNGLLVPPRDSHTLSDAVEYLLDNKSIRDAMGREGRTHVESDFEVGAVVEKTLDVYDSALTERV